MSSQQSHPQAQALALTRRSAETQLMPPPSKRIKRPATVLDEDTYTDAISDIIARDFFPGLLETRTQQEYLDALESRDREWISSAGRKLTEVMTPGPRRGRRATSLAPSQRPETPRGFAGDTPLSMASPLSTTSVSTGPPQPQVDIHMSLDAFQAKYTSEDNESFNQLLDKQNRTRAERYAWLWAGNKIPAPRQIKYRERQARLAAEKEGAGENGDAGRAVAVIEAPDVRKAMPDGWKAKADNQLMFEPDGIEDELQTVQQAAEASSRAPPKAVIYNNTRLPAPAAEASSTTPSSPSLSAVRDAIAGRSRPTASEPGFSGGETPRVNGYAFVDEEPTPAELSHTPLLLGTGDATPNPFKIKEASQRESLHRRMVDRVAKNNRPSPHPGAAGSSSRSTTPVPKFVSSPRVGTNLTPAAQRLWTKMGSPGSRGATGMFGSNTGTPGKSKPSGLRHRWTPTPRAVQKGKE
ncbi:MAG: hypothetical protein M1838_005626 [Thelocarpon superellum]|nr:MAG: hypothetical protein M1838_005626 [Thelocarpon superellum]